MKSFPILVNGETIISTDVYDYIKRGKTSQAIDYVMNETNCTEKEALEVINDLRELVQQSIKTKVEKSKEPRIQTNRTVIDCTQSTQQQNVPKCPTCGSTNIRKMGTGERTASILGFGILSKKINKTWKCNNCGHTW